MRKRTRESWYIIKLTASGFQGPGEIIITIINHFHIKTNKSSIINRFVNSYHPHGGNSATIEAQNLSI